VWTVAVGWSLTPGAGEVPASGLKALSNVNFEPIPQPESRASFLAVGDILLSRGVAQRMRQQRDPLLPFRSLADLLNSTDFNFGNLESPVSGNDEVKGRGLIFNTATDDLAGLRKYNFKILNLANNHSLDQRLPGLENTRRVLFDAGIDYVGVGDNKTEAWKPRIITVNGIRVGFLGASYASVNDGGVDRNENVARIEDLTELKDALARLKSQVDFVVVTMHAGIEFKRYPHSSQIDFARAAVDFGADLVIGAHPHWIQTIEQYQGKYIFYSLGNFVFDANHEDTSQGLTLKVVLRKQKFPNPNMNHFGQVQVTELERVELIPVVIQQYSPRPATDKESQLILKKIGITTSVITEGEKLLARR
jgi:poly-gamma-glutamate synthesis protein (capsule biosynthesis protein)